MRMRRKVFLFVTIIFFLSTFGGHSVALDVKEKAPPKPPSIDRRPDLIVTRIAIVSEHVDAKNLRYKFTIYVKNRGLSSTSGFVNPVGTRNDSRGRCKGLFEWTADDRTYKVFAEFTVPALAAGAEYKYSCGSQVLARGVFRRYRATIDHSDWINETNETNNNKFESIMVP